MLQLCSSCGRTARAIVGHIKQPPLATGWAALRYQAAFTLDCAFFKVFNNSGKIIISEFFEAFILQFVTTVGRTLVDSAMKTNTWFITLKYIYN